MDAFFQALIVRAATIDELLSDAFEPLPGQKSDADQAARRLAAWCRSCASGDWSLFNRRLERDGLSFADVLARLATVRRKASAPAPKWIDDAIWIEAALQNPGNASSTLATLPFEQLFAPLAAEADAKLSASLGERALSNLTDTARASLRHLLLKELSGLCAAALYERFDKVRKAAASADADNLQRSAATCQYDRFVADMRAGGFRRLFEDKPVLLRLIATVTRQWLDSTAEFILRLDADLPAVRRDLLERINASRVAGVEGDLSDRHNGGRSVLILTFEDGARVVYKPKDLRLDAAWHALVERLNPRAPIELRAMRALACNGYGWTEFIQHAGCADVDGCKRFFRRAGAWLALFHCFAGNDMHQENVIAAGEHPVPIDLETILQASDTEHEAEEIEAQAHAAAMDAIENSVLTVGLLPAYGRSPEHKIFSVGGMMSDGGSRARLAWSNINSDTMRPMKTQETNSTVPNLPHVDGAYARFGDHIDDFVAGFEDYARFLFCWGRGDDQIALLDGFAGLPTRRVVRPTRFYYLLLQRLKNHRSMEDGVLWSVQADFLARLSDWDKDRDPLWPLQHAERAALLALNVPFFACPSDGREISDASGVTVRAGARPGLDRASARLRNFDERDIAWQIEVIRQNTAAVVRLREGAAVRLNETRVLRGAGAAPGGDTFLAEADKVAAELARHAVRRGPAAAWIGLDWLGDSEVAQLVPLGGDLYNGASGIALFLSAHAAVAGSELSRELALAAVVHLRKSLKGRNAARVARSLGTGGATGLGSVVYAFAVMSKCLGDGELLADAHTAAGLFSDDLIAADNQLDAVSGCAGGILGLLRLYRDGRSADVLRRAETCGEHLLAQPRVGRNGGSWLAHGPGERPLNGMSHGAAGFAYALTSLAAATGRDDFAHAAAQCIVFENSSYDAQRNNWPDLRGDDAWLCQWCHGAAGIGMARAASLRSGRRDAALLERDVRNALAGVERAWPAAVDTFCCGTLGNIEFLCEAGHALGRGDLLDLASQRMAEVMANAQASGDYVWNVGKRRFNLGLFRGLSGVGYACLRQADRSLPNVLIWE